MTPEGKVQKRIIEGMKRHCIKTLRLVFREGVSVGWPDTMILLPGGRPAFIEVKRPGEEPTAKQWEKLNWLAENGYRVAYFDDADEAQEWLDDLIREDAACAGQP